MKRFFLIVLSVGLFLTAGNGFAELKLNGLFRNDFVLTGQTTRVKMSDVMENRFVFTRRTDNWRFYTDARLYLLYGKASEMPLNLTLPVSGVGLVTIQTNLSIPVNISLMRAFVRFYTEAGDFTLGKTYVNFGKKGAFNPFEMNKSVNFNDMSYDHEGLLGLLWSMGWGNNLEIQAYASPKQEWTNSAGGLSLETHLGTFDIGAMYNRKQYDRNVAGLYFQGDLELGVHGSYAYHCDDTGGAVAHEANLGVDYSFFANKLLLAADYYYSSGGATNSNDYVTNSTKDRYFQAAHYAYGNITFTPDEFSSFQVPFFVNLVDGSMLFLPSVRYTLFDGMDWILQGGIFEGKNGSEFDPTKDGRWTLDVRCEVKL